MSATLSDATSAIERGELTLGQELLLEIVSRDPGNSAAWLWLAQTYDDPAKRRECLEQVLALDPDNDEARELLTQPYNQSRVSGGSGSGRSIRSFWPAILGSCGALLLLAGSFLPIVEVSSIGQVSFWQIDRLMSQTYGTLVVGMAILSLLFVAVRRYSWLWLTGLASFVLVTNAFAQLFVFQNRLTFGDIHWLGWLVMFPGVTLLIIVAARSSRRFA